MSLALHGATYDTYPSSLIQAGGLPSPQPLIKDRRPDPSRCWSHGNPSKCSKCYAAVSGSQSRLAMTSAACRPFPIVLHKTQYMFCHSGATAYCYKSSYRRRRLESSLIPHDFPRPAHGLSLIERGRRQTRGNPRLAEKLGIRSSVSCRGLIFDKSAGAELQNISIAAGCCQCQ